VWVTVVGRMYAEHHQSHRELLREFDAGPPRKVDAVVVPAGRTARHLRHAAQLATELGCVLLALGSPGRVDAADFASMVVATYPRLVWRHLTLPDSLSHALLPATASPQARSRDWRHGALSTKRNLALLLARLCGWRTVVLVDDDIRDIDAEVVRSAAGRLDKAFAIGLAVDRFPDNSVVCHANRLAGGAQEVFVGASALVLDTSGSFGFFPNVYNEDWLFLYDGVAAGAVGRLHRATQLPYKPFADRARAEAEEFGDVIAEGLMSALDLFPELGPPMDTDYWQAFLRARRDFIASTADRLDPTTDPDHGPALLSLKVAEDRRSEISARDCVEFVRTWRADQLVWTETVAELPRLHTIDAAAAFLGISDTLTSLTA
jgi:hypothetical protein